MKTDMKFPCLVTCNTFQCIAINENHVVHLEGDYRGQVCIATTVYTEPDLQTRYGHKSEDYEFFGMSVSNSIDHFDITVHEGLTITRSVEVNDIDFSPWKGGTEQFFDDIDRMRKVGEKIGDMKKQERKHGVSSGEGVTKHPQPWKPTVGEQVNIIRGVKVHNGEVLFLSEKLIVLKFSNGYEDSFKLDTWEITKPVTPESKLKDLWFECGQDIDLFLTQVNKQYEEQS